MLRVPSTSTFPVATIDNTQQFYEDLQRFFASSGQKVSGAPLLNGKPVQLFQLYNTVVNRGGWQKICQQNAWDEVAEALGLPERSANGSHAVKIIYYQYLLRYECAKFNRAPVDDVMDEDDVIRRFSLTGTTISRIPEYLRASCGLPPSNSDDYLEKLRLSLISGLPNEVDFAVNALLIRSADSSSPLIINDCHASLLDSVSGAVGVFGKRSRQLISIYNTYIEETEKDFIRFWMETTEDMDLCSLLYAEDSIDQPLTCGVHGTELFARMFSFECNEMRVGQVATILHNLSMEKPNRTIITQSETCLKIILLCANSRCGSIYQLGISIITHLISEMKSRFSSFDWLHPAVLRIVRSCLEGADRQRLLTGLSLVTRMCDMDKSAEFLDECLESQHYLMFSQNLCVPDPDIVIATLELLYKITRLGERHSTTVAETSENIEVLIRLMSCSAEQIQAGFNEPLVPVECHETAPLRPTSPSKTVEVLQHSVPVPMGSTVSNQEAEKTMEWFRQVYEEDEAFAMPISEVYKDYVEFCNGTKKFSPLLPSFTHCYQLAFPKARTASLALAGKQELCLSGIKRRTLPGSQLSSATSFSTFQPQSSVPSASIADGSSLPVNHADPSTPKRQKKPSDSSLIRSLLATKINRKQSSSYTDEWKPSENHDRIDVSKPDSSLLSLSDGLFSDMESNDSSFVSPMGKSPRSRSTSSASDSPKAKRKPTVRKKKIDGVIPNGNSTPTNGLVNGLNGDSQSSTDLSVAVPYVLSEAIKPAKKPRGRPRINGTPNGIPPALQNGFPEGSAAHSPARSASTKKPRRSSRKPKPKKTEEMGVPNGLVLLNGQTTTETSPESILNSEGPKKPKRRKKSVEASSSADTSTESVEDHTGTVSAVQTAVMSGEESDFVCEWEGCSRSFGKTASAVFRHNFVDHVFSSPESICRWAGCNPMKRHALSLITHLQEHHCSPAELLRQAVRRQEVRRTGQSSIPQTIVNATPPTYSEHAALHSIQARYASAVAADFASEPESPSTRTIRLTAALILRNIAHYSHVGRIKLYKFEPVLTLVAMQGSEASRVIGECLFYLASHKTSA
ncbi:hypothetical protein RvY_08906 [Ramazzottius varieornatus]|uniref:ARID domain-containing protein n=1 Tax=Ramazzottius varieornatus TaxID=947166 RepID=A0A1D1V7L9_RAMVA|nr:hypothetical protein RvY_08906 [Ramazzottius varieornatus]